MAVSRWGTRKIINILQHTLFVLENLLPFFMEFFSFRATRFEYQKSGWQLGRSRNLWFFGSL